MRTHPDRIFGALLSLHPVIGSAVRELLVVSPMGFEANYDHDEQIAKLDKQLRALEDAHRISRANGSAVASQMTFDPYDKRDFHAEARVQARRRGFDVDRSFGSSVELRRLCLIWPAVKVRHWHRHMIFEHWPGLGIPGIWLACMLGNYLLYGVPRGGRLLFSAVTILFAAVSLLMLGGFVLERLEKWVRRELEEVSGWYARANFADEHAQQ